jgi:uncharacterized protein (DUF1499 family)
MTGARDRGPRWAWTRAITGLGAAVTLAAAATLMLAPLGYRAGIWSLSIALNFLPRVVAYYAGIAGATISLVALVVTVAAKRSGWATLAVIGFVVGAGTAYVPWKFVQMGRELPPVNDITTDTANPPPFEAVMPLREAAHAQPVVYSPSFPVLQKQAFPDIVAPHLDRPVDQAFSLALEAVRKMGRTIVAADGERGRIEATDRSFWYGFTDDIVVRVSADGSGSRVDVRSKSRIGRGDFGTNARRVRAFLAAIKSVGAS